MIGQENPNLLDHAPIYISNDAHFEYQTCHIENNGGGLFSNKRWYVEQYETVTGYRENESRYHLIPKSESKANTGIYIIIRPIECPSMY